MKSMDFPEANRTLKGGGNQNTQGLRVSIATCSGYKEGTLFFVSKWELEESERYTQAYHIYEALKKYWADTPENERSDNKLLNVVMNSIQPLYLCAMHTPPPVLLLSGGRTPWDIGYKPIPNLPPPIIDPKDN